MGYPHDYGNHHITTIWITTGQDEGDVDDDDLFFEVMTEHLGIGRRQKTIGLIGLVLREDLGFLKWSYPKMNVCEWKIPIYTWMIARMVYLEVPLFEETSKCT